MKRKSDQTTDVALVETTWEAAWASAAALGLDDLIVQRGMGVLLVYDVGRDLIVTIDLMKEVSARALAHRIIKLFAEPKEGPPTRPTRLRVRDARLAEQLRLRWPVLLPGIAHN